MSLEAQYRKTLSDIWDKLRPIVNKDGAMTVTEAVDALAARLAEVQGLADKAQWFLDEWKAKKIHSLEVPGMTGLFAVELKNILQAVAKTADSASAAPEPTMVVANYGTEIYRGPPSGWARFKLQPDTLYNLTAKYVDDSAPAINPVDALRPVLEQVAKENGRDIDEEAFARAREYLDAPVSAPAVVTLKRDMQDVTMYGLLGPASTKREYAPGRAHWECSKHGEIDGPDCPHCNAETVDNSR